LPQALPGRLANDILSGWHYESSFESFAVTDEKLYSPRQRQFIIGVSLLASENPQNLRESFLPAKFAKAQLSAVCHVPLKIPENSLSLNLVER